MNTQMGSSLPSEKLDRSNDSQDEPIPIGQGYWSYINDAQENRPNPKNADYSTWCWGRGRKCGSASNILDDDEPV